jgi:hypothetical protein
MQKRLSSFYHWNDMLGLEQAINICLEQKIDLQEVEKWSSNEGQLEKFNLFKKLLKVTSHSPTKN